MVRAAGQTRRTVLVLAAAADRRASSRSLLDAVQELRRRPDTTVALWYLRSGVALEDGSPGPDRVVDDLRTWGPAATADRLLGPAVGNRLRGLRLRRWLADLAPDVVLLDDGLGERILGRLPAGAVRIARRNPLPPASRPLEPAGDPQADLWLVAPGAEPAPADAVRVLADRPVRDLATARALAEPEVQARQRASVGLPADALVVVGWGAGWLDGADLFPRLLWALEDRHDVIAHGLWVGPLVTAEDEARLRAEAVRCGVGDRYHLVRGDRSLRTCGDVAVLPYRDRADDPLEPTAELPTVPFAIAAGLPVVTFPVAAAEPDPALTVVPDLDVDAVAAAVAALLPTGPDQRAVRVASARERLDVGPWVDEVLAAVAGISAR